MIIEQQKSGSRYEIPRTVLGVIVLTSPYKIDQLTGQPIKESVMSIDFDPRNLKDERISIWKHQLLFLNPNPKYKNEYTPGNYQDWLDLLYASVNEQTNYKLNINNLGVAKTLDPETRHLMKISESKKAMISINDKDSKKERDFEIAKKMKDKGEPIEIIIEYTSLTQKEIEKL